MAGAVMAGCADVVCFACTLYGYSHGSESDEESHYMALALPEEAPLPAWLRAFLTILNERDPEKGAKRTATIVESRALVHPEGEETGIAAHGDQR